MERPLRPSEPAERAQPRLQVGDLVMANGKAPANYRARFGVITEISDDGAECRVEFEDGIQPTTGHLKAMWLDL
jgi:hypothetical protein